MRTELFASTHVVRNIFMYMNERLFTCKVNDQLKMENATNDTNGEETQRPNAVVITQLEQLLNVQFPKQKYVYELQRATQKGENYIGVVYRISVELFQAAEASHNNFSLILKVPPQNEIQRHQFFARPCFLRESLAYEKFLPLAQKFQDDKVNDKNLTFHEFPECYGSQTDEFNEAIFMEDLRVKDFKLFDRFAPIDNEHVALVMRTYGKLHAVSFAIKDQQPEILEDFQQIVDIFEQRKNDRQLASYFEELKTSSLATLDSKNDASSIKVLKKYLDQGTYFDLFLSLIDGKRCEPYAVVCHGDCWNNNILYKYEHGKPKEVRLIDWQVMRYASPITDLFNFLFTCTSSDFRMAHFEEMMNIYYEEVTNHIRRLGSDPRKVFPREAFDGQLRSIGAVGLLFAMMVLPITTTRPEDAPNLAELSERINSGDTTDLKGAGLLCENNSTAYRTRMRDTVLDSIYLGFI